MKAGLGDGVATSRAARAAVLGAAKLLVARKAERKTTARTRAKDCIVGEVSAFEGEKVKTVRVKRVSG